MLVPCIAEEGGGKSGHSLPMDRDWKVENGNCFIRLELLALALSNSRSLAPEGDLLAKTSPINQFLSPISRATL